MLAVIVSFADPGLEAAIREEIGKPVEDIYDTDLVDLEFLDASERSISNLEGIQNCTDLTTLYLDHNCIVDISPLSSLTKLTFLDLDHNQIVDISAVSDLTELTFLDVNHNQIVDISAVSGLTGLTYLDMNNNQIVNISSLSALTNLTRLYLYTNKIVSVSAVSDLTNLTRLYLYINQIADITPLVGNTGIGSGDVVEIRWNQLLLAPGSPDMLDIEALQGRGVGVTYDPQNPPSDTAAVFRIEDGFVFADGTFHAVAFESGGADVAEWVHMSMLVEPGDVVEFDPITPGRYRIAEDTCSSLVAGVVSTTPGVTLGGSLAASEKALLALTGIVPVKVTNEGGPIQPGDLLVTSATPGYAMRWAGPDPCLCSVVGKALEPMTEECGVILVLLTAH